MLKPLVSALCCVSLVDSLLLAAALFGAAYAFDANVPGPSSAHIEPLAGAALWRYWIQAAIGAALALPVRAYGRRLTAAKLVPLSIDGAMHAAVQAASYTLYFLALYMYRVRLHDPVHALASPFANGILQSCAALLIAMLVCWCVVAWAAPQYATPLTARASPFAATAYAACIVMLVDLAAFEHGHWIALLVCGFVAVAWFTAHVLTAVGDDEREERVSRKK